MSDNFKEDFMRNFCLGLVLLVSALPAFAEVSEINNRPCQVVAVDRYQRIVARFYGNSHPRDRMCRNALRQCNYEVRRRGWWDVRCRQLGNRW